MTKARPAALGAGLVAKGQAAPAAFEHPVAPTTPVAAVAPPAQPTLKTPEYYKALTLKLTRDRYKALKAAGIAEDKHSQEILVEALDAWLIARPL